MHSRPESCSEDEIEEHLDSIDHVPTAILPDDSLARRALRLLAAAGRDGCPALPVGNTCARIGPSNGRSPPVLIALRGC